jgi:hypothetical protein
VETDADQHAERPAQGGRRLPPEPLLGLHAVPPAAPRAVTREELFDHLHPESLQFLPRIKAETVFGPDGRTIGTASYWIPSSRTPASTRPTASARRRRG